MSSPWTSCYVLQVAGRESILVKTKLVLSKLVELNTHTII